MMPSVNGDNYAISSKIGGRIEKVLVDNNDSGEARAIVGDPWMRAIFARNWHRRARCWQPQKPMRARRA